MLTTELKTHFIRLYQMALSDDDFNVFELELLFHIAEERGMPKETLEKLLVDPTLYNAALPESVEERIAYLYDLTRIMWADGKVTEDEVTTLKKYCTKFGFLPENVEEISDYLIACVRDGVSKQHIINQLHT